MAHSTHKLLKFYENEIRKKLFCQFPKKMVQVSMFSEIVTASFEIIDIF